MKQYRINKGVNRPVEFKGLKAQYIWWLGIGLAAILLLFVLLYLLGVATVLLVPLALVGGVVLFVRVYALNRKYGQHGLMKAMASKKVPKVVVVKKKPL